MFDKKSFSSNNVKAPGWTSIMSQGSSVMSMKDKKFVLRRTMADGKIKEYEDEKKEFIQIELELPDGRVFKFYEENVRIMDVPKERLKAIEVYSNDNDLLDTVTIDFNQHQLIDPVYIFISHGDSIGEGTGNVTYYIAQKLLGEDLDPRYVTGTKVDQRVIDEFKKMGLRDTTALTKLPEDPFDKYEK
jgi:hypothetical protein